MGLLVCVALCCWSVLFVESNVKNSQLTRIPCVGCVLVVCWLSWFSVFLGGRWLSRFRRACKVCCLGGSVAMLGAVLIVVSSRNAGSAEPVTK